MNALTALNTPSAVIAALDGPTKTAQKIARRIGRPLATNTVATWPVRDRIPAEYLLAVNAELAALDPPQSASPSVFGIIEPNSDEAQG